MSHEQPTDSREMIVPADRVATGTLRNVTFHDQAPVFYTTLIENELRRRFGDVEESFVDLTRTLSAETVIAGIHYTRTLAGAFRIWRAERRGLNRRAVLNEVDRRIIALEEVQ